MRAQYRIKEKDVYLPALRLLNETKSGFMRTANLIRALESEFKPDGADAEILENRSGTRFTQIVRNIVSHRDVLGNIIYEGLADYDGKLRGMRITEAGRRRISESGFQNTLP